VLFVLVMLLGTSFRGPSCGKIDGEPVGEIGDKHEGFVVVWFAICALVVSVGGTYVMRKQRTLIGLGLFVGAIFMLFNWTLCTAVLLGGQINKKRWMNETCGMSYGTAGEGFAIFLAVVLLGLYGAFGGILVKAKDTLLSEEAMSGGSGGEYPSAAFQNIDSQDEQLTAV